MPTEFICHICCETSKFKVIGKCDHQTCISCVATLRDICDQKVCAICRESLEKVICVHDYEEGTFEKLEKSCRVSGPKPGYKFQDTKVLNHYRELFAYRCKVCKEILPELSELERHLEQRHKKKFCKICQEHLKVFTKDLSVYSKDELRVHKVKGDKNDKSMKGHPLCEFCQDRFLDNEALHIHLRKAHFWCHICTNQAYYCNYADLRQHFANSHYLCERGDCVNEQLTNVFRTDIDLQAHIASTHREELGKSQQRQMRQIQPSFTSSRSARYHMDDSNITDIGDWSLPSGSARAKRGGKGKRSTAARGGGGSSSSGQPPPHSPALPRTTSAHARPTPPQPASAQPRHAHPQNRSTPAQPRPTPAQPRPTPAQPRPTPAQSRPTPSNRLSPPAPAAAKQPSPPAPTAATAVDRTEYPSIAETTSPARSPARPRRGRGPGPGPSVSSEEWPTAAESTEGRQTYRRDNGGRPGGRSKVNSRKGPRQTNILREEPRGRKGKGHIDLQDANVGRPPEPIDPTPAETKQPKDLLGELNQLGEEISSEHGSSSDPPPSLPEITSSGPPPSLSDIFGAPTNSSDPPLPPASPPEEIPKPSQPPPSISDILLAPSGGEQPPGFHPPGLMAPLAPPMMQNGFGPPGHHHHRHVGPLPGHRGPPPGHQTRAPTHRLPGPPLPGNMEPPPGHLGPPPGHNGPPTGHSGPPPGHNGPPPGHSGPPPGHNGPPPGHSGPPPGHNGPPPGHNGPPPGHHGPPPGHNGPPPGHNGPPPGHNGPPPGHQGPPGFREFQPDPKIKERNEALKDALQKELGGSLFVLYHDAVNAFSQNKIDSESFLSISRKYISPAALPGLMRELVTLLPNIAQQHALFRSLGRPAELIPCCQCNQIFRTADIRVHTCQ